MDWITAVLVGSSLKAALAWDGSHSSLWGGSLPAHLYSSLGVVLSPHRALRWEEGQEADPTTGVILRPIRTP